MRRSLLARRRSWTDNVLNFFFSGLQKSEQRAKKCIELRGEYAEQIPSLVAVAFFLPGRAKDLSAPPSIYLCISRDFRSQRDFFLNSVNQLAFPAGKQFIFLLSNIYNFIGYLRDIRV